MATSAQTSRAQRIAEIEQELEAGLPDLKRARALVDAKQRELAALRQGASRPPGRTSAV